MVLKSIAKIIEDLEKSKTQIPLEKQHYITKYLLVGYDIEGRAYSDDLIIKSQNGISEYDYAKTRLQRQVRSGEITKEDMNRKMSNSTRNFIREKLIRRFGAMYLSDSLYLVPLQVIRNDEGKKLELSDAEQFLEAWGLQNGVKLHAMANTPATQRAVEHVSKAYNKVLQDRFDEMDESLDHAFKKIKDLQDEVAQDPQKTIRGIHRIVEAIEARSNEAQDLINRYGDPEKDQFHLQKIMLTTKGIREIYEHIREMKERQK